MNILCHYIYYYNLPYLFIYLVVQNVKVTTKDLKYTWPRFYTKTNLF